MQILGCDFYSSLNVDAITQPLATSGGREVSARSNKGMGHKTYTLELDDTYFTVLCRIWKIRQNQQCPK